MSGEREPAGPRRRSRRSTMLGIALLVALAVIIIAVVWGVQRWTEEDMEGPSVVTPIEIFADVATLTRAETAANSIGAVLIVSGQHAVPSS